MQLNVAYSFLPKRPTVHTGQVMGHFGVGFEQGQHVIAEDLELPINTGQIVCFTGDSGSGKSSLLRAAAAQLNDVLSLDDVTFGQGSLIDELGVEFTQGLAIMAACGLSEAQLLLRSPAELSEGQRYRFRLAKAIAARPAWVLADEFTATLDRTLAQVIAFNIRKLCRREGIGFLLATTHQDILADLAADVHIRCQLGTAPLIETAAADDSDGTSDDCNDPRRGKKKGSGCSTTSGSVGAPRPTGRISLGGITAVTRSGS